MTLGGTSSFCGPDCSFLVSTYLGWLCCSGEFCLRSDQGFVGLLSLAVEFYRADTSRCVDDQGNPISSEDFTYGITTCNLTCSTEDGPFIPTRGGSANNIYVIPRPVRLTFGTATLLAAACCIPAVLSIFSMWTKVLYVGWKERFGNRADEENLDEPIEGTNGATLRQMKRVNDELRKKLSIAVEIPVFGAAVMAILIIGERNFFSRQVNYQTEPIASVGKFGWSSPFSSSADAFMLL
jgi:hypothetical protein